MSQRDFLQSQLIETERMLTMAPDHPLMTPGLRARKAALEAELQNLPAETPGARAQLFFSGAPVFGSVGIDAEFVSKILSPFARMVKAQCATTAHRAEAPEVTGEDFESRLLLTALPRGSFGLELARPQRVAFVLGTRCGRP